MKKISELALREEIPIYKKMQEKPKDGRHLVKYKVKKEYDYYKCDYCEDEIKILNKRHEMTGGIVIIPRSITKSKEIKLALCTKCLKSVLRLFGE